MLTISCFAYNLRCNAAFVHLTITAATKCRRIFSKVVIEIFSLFDQTFKHLSIGDLEILALITPPPTQTILLRLNNKIVIVVLLKTSHNLE